MIISVGHVISAQVLTSTYQQQKTEIYIIVPYAHWCLTTTHTCACAHRERESVCVCVYACACVYACFRMHIERQQAQSINISKLPSRPITINLNINTTIQTSI